MNGRKEHLSITVFLLILTAAVFFALGMHYDVLRGGREYNTLVVYTDTPAEGAGEEDSATSTTEAAAPGTVPLNSATVEQLMTVPGIGEAFARRIVDYREAVGGFASLEQLMEVEGIGEGRYANWSPYFTLGEFSD